MLRMVQQFGTTNITVTILSSSVDRDFLKLIDHLKPFRINILAKWNELENKLISAKICYFILP